VDYQVLFNLAITAAAFFGGWTLSRIYAAIDRLDADVRNLPHDYVSKDDYRTDMKEIKEQLSKIIDKLDDKADK
jgi:predicted RNA-binding protein with EMAP domain